MKKIVNKAVRSLALVLAFSLSCTTAFAGVLKKPYLIYEGANSTMTVLWQDNATETTNTLSWGTDISYGLGSIAVSEYGPSNQHKYQITGLTPGTKYCYKVEDATNGVYGTGSFVTAPAAAANSVKFLAFGDTRSGPLAMEAVIQEMRKVYAADPAFQSLNIQAGDWVASDAESNWTNEWFNANPQTRLMLAEQPVSGVKGNHEDASGYSKYYPKYYPFPYPQIALKSGTTDTYNNLFYSFDFGPVHFTVVDQYSGYSVGSAQYNWMVNDLTTTTKPWKILVYHEPAWTAGTHGNNVTTQQVFDPLIKQYGVDLVYAGHNHNYARCQANDSIEAGGDSIAPKVPYITNGGGGAGLYAVDTTNTGAYRHVVKALSQYEYSTFEINDRTLTMSAYAVTKADGSNLSASVINPDTKSTLIETVTVIHPRVDNQAPTVALTAPAAGAVFGSPASIDIAANAGDDVAVAKVEFYNGSVKLGESTAAPYRFTWSGVPTGNYTITAVATDNEGVRTVSGLVNVLVHNLNNVPPSVAISAPADGATLYAGGPVTLTVTAADTDGTVTKVAYYAGATKLGEVATTPYSFTWPAVPAGNYTLTAVATDSDFATTTSTPVNVSVVPAPAGGTINFTENFDSMGTTGTTPPAGWSIWNANSGTSNTTWLSSIPANGANSVASMVNAAGALTATTTPSATNNNGYNAAAAGNTADRMLATSPTSVAGAAIQLQLTNSSSGYIDRLMIGYDIYRINASASLNELPGYWLFYSLDNGTTWMNVAALNPTDSGPNGVIVPNTVGKTNVPTTIITLANKWNPGASILFRWVDDNGQPTSPDQMYGLDNVSITTQITPTITLGCDHTSPQAPGTTVVFTANAGSGYDYRFSFFNGTSWAMVQDYGGGATWTLPATTPVGKYVIAVDARYTPGVDREAVTYVSYEISSGPATGVTITPNQPNPHIVGTPVVFTGTGTSYCDYRFSLFNGTSWTMVQNYGGGAAWTLPASTPTGKYVVAVDVRTTTAVDRDTVAYLNYEVIAGTASGVIITPDSPSPINSGTSVVFTAAGQGSSGCDYRFWLFDGTNWAMVQNYGGGATWTLPASTPAGNYVVAVDVRTSSTVNRDAVQYLPYLVN